MKKLFITLMVLVGLSLTLVGAMAAGNDDAWEFVGKLTGKTTEEIAELRGQGFHMGQLALDVDKLDEFKAYMTERRAEILEQKVADGLLTQAEADALKVQMEARQADCTGDGTNQAVGGMRIRANSNGANGGQGRRGNR
jgi:hypothetical protein